MCESKASLDAFACKSVGSIVVLSIILAFIFLVFLALSFQLCFSRSRKPKRKYDIEAPPPMRPADWTPHVTKNGQIVWGDHLMNWRTSHTDDSDTTISQMDLSESKATPINFPHTLDSHIRASSHTDKSTTDVVSKNTSPYMTTLSSTKSPQTKASHKNASNTDTSYTTTLHKIASHTNRPHTNISHTNITHTNKYHTNTSHTNSRRTARTTASSNRSATHRLDEHMKDLTEGKPSRWNRRTFPGARVVIDARSLPGVNHTVKIRHLGQLEPHISGRDTEAGYKDISHGYFIGQEPEVKAREMV